MVKPQTKNITIEKVFYVYVLQWYDMYPKPYLEFDDDDNPIPRVNRELGESDPEVFLTFEHCAQLVASRTPDEEWTEITPNRLWRNGNYWIKRVILGFDCLDDIEYEENYRQQIDENRYSTWRKRD